MTSLIKQVRTPKPTFRSSCIKPTCGSYERSRARALGSITAANGACTVCKQPISKARLEAVPWTHLCRECKEQETFSVNAS